MQLLTAILNLCLNAIEVKLGFSYHGGGVGIGKSIHRWYGSSCRWDKEAEERLVGF